MSVLDLFKARAAEADNVAQPESSHPEFWRDPFEPLRRKWAVLPLACQERARINDVMELSDADLLSLWEQALHEQVAGPGFQVRGWYHSLYAFMVQGKKVLDVGAGLGFDSLTFAKLGAELTFVDLVPSTLRVLQRLCGLMGIRNARFAVLDRVESLKSLPTDFDIIMAIGSLINAPFEVIRAEVQELIKHLKIGGRWLHFAYPKCRLGARRLVAVPPLGHEDRRAWDALDGMV